MLPGQLLKQTVRGSLRGQPAPSALLALHVLLHASSEQWLLGDDVVLEHQLTVRLSPATKGAEVAAWRPPSSSVHMLGRIGGAFAPHTRA